MDYLRLMQHNIQSVNNKKPLLKSLLYENKIDVCLLNETWLKDSGLPFYIPGYIFVGKNAKNEHGGVGILIKNNIKFKVLKTTFYQNIQFIAISIITVCGPVSVLCVYCPPNNSSISLSTLRKIILQLPKPCLVSGDFNAHNIAFGCDTSNSRGRELFDIFDDADLCILNTGDPTTISRPGNNASAIDVTCVSPDIAPLCEWYVGDDSLGSYHLPTFVNIITSTQKYTVQESIHKYLYNKTNWNMYKDKSKDIFDNFSPSTVDPLVQYDEFSKLLLSLKENCIPLLKHKSSSKKSAPPAPWWNDTCAEAVTKSREALANYRRNMTMDNYIEYKKIDSRKKIIIKLAKKDSWKSLCSSFNRFTPVSRVWNFIRRFKRININRNLSKNDEWIESFLEKLAQPSNNNDNISGLFEFNDGSQWSMFLLNSFYFEELDLALSSRKNTTPGLDDIPYIMLQNLHVSD